jgi:hypothetical protein
MGGVRYSYTLNVVYFVEALCYKPKGRRLKSRWGHWTLFLLPHPSSCTMALGFTHPLTEMSTGKKCFWGAEGGRRERLTNHTVIVSRMSRQCGILNISQHYRPPRPIWGITLVYLDSALEKERERYVRPASWPGSFTTGETALGTHHTRGRVSLMAGLGTVHTISISCLNRESNPGFLRCQGRNTFPVWTGTLLQK